jgi:hypothetical protein
MATLWDRHGSVEISGESAPLLDRLEDPLRRALAGRGRFYAVRVEALGRVGEVLVSITGSKGRLPLLLRTEDLEPGDVFRAVSDTVDRYGF